MYEFRKWKKLASNILFSLIQQPIMPYFIKILGTIKKNTCAVPLFVKCSVYYVNNPMDLFYGSMFFSETELMVRYESFTFYNRSNLLQKKQLHYFGRNRKQADRAIGLDIIRAFAQFNNHFNLSYFSLRWNEIYVRKVNSFSGRFFCNFAVIKSYSGLFLGFNEFIIDLISYFENHLIGTYLQFLLVLD